MNIDLSNFYNVYCPNQYSVLSALRSDRIYNNNSYLVSSAEAQLHD